MSTHNGLFKNPVEFDMALKPACFAMAHRGVRIDKEKLAEFHEDFHKQKDRAYEMLDEVVGYKLKAKKSISDDKVKKYLYGEMKVKERKKDKKVTSDEDALRAIMADTKEAIKKAKREDVVARHMQVFTSIKIILRIKELEKKLTSYIDIDFDDTESGLRARCTPVVGGAETARFAHTKTVWDTGLNMATVPRKVRQMFVADEGMELCELDLNRGESWVYAHLSGDPTLLSIHLENRDFHAITASALSNVFGKKSLSAEEIIKLYKSGDNFGYMIRYMAKRVNHASAYLMGPFVCAESINAEADETGITITPSKAREAQEAWMGLYIMMPQWWERTKKIIDDTRTLTTPFGRIRQFYRQTSNDIHAKIYKEAVAYVPQSTSVDYLNLGMLRVYNELVVPRVMGIELLHQQHDSILIQYPKDRRDEVIPAVKSKMDFELKIGRYAPFKIPTDASYGDNWYELKGWKG